MFFARPVGPPGKIRTNFAPPRKNYHENCLAMRGAPRAPPHSQGELMVIIAKGREIGVKFAMRANWLCKTTRNPRSC